MKKINILLASAVLCLCCGCEDLFTPAPENYKDAEQMNSDAQYAQRILMNAYRIIPKYYNDTDYATDDAVTNSKSNGYMKMATGSWTSSNNPVDLWTDGFAAIQNVNLFLEKVDEVHWTDDEESRKLFACRLKGEAYGLRALHTYFLLRNHAGFSNDGELLGIPLYDSYLGSDANFNQPRASFYDCVKHIYDDLDKAEQMLPMEYNDISNESEIPERFQSYTNRKETYNRVMGHYGRQLFNALIAKGLRARVALFAASPAFVDASNGATWAEAADAAAEVIDYAGGVGGIDAKGFYWFGNTAELDKLGEGLNPAEIIWREGLSTNNTEESNHFPPSLFGKGYMNPSQNLIDAFPMAEGGYPINDDRGSFDESKPYEGRDARFAQYIIYNGSKAGVTDKPVMTGSQSGTDDGINVKETSTRTGYYMKKRTRQDASNNPSGVVKKIHYNPRMRYTEIYLAYAEAANEAYGPTNTGGHSYSAYDVMKALRSRAGIKNDAYLEECKGNQEKMQQLIRNERRLELCFEGFRFWDLRRWKAPLNETVRGYDSSTGEEFDVEERLYKDYMYYGPIPYSETLKYSNLKQNKGW